MKNRNPTGSWEWLKSQTQFAKETLKKNMQSTLHQIKIGLTHHLTKSHNGAKVFMKSNLDKIKNLLRFHEKDMVGAYSLCKDSNAPS